MRKALLIAAAALTGCASVKLPPLTADAAEHSQCTSYGLSQGTPEYGQCRIQLQQLRIQRSQVLLGAGAGLLQSNQPRPYIMQTNPNPSPFSSYQIDGRTYNCSTIGTATSCF